MNELTGKDKAIVQALEAYGYYIGGVGEPDDDEAFSEYLEDRGGTAKICSASSRLKNWIVTNGKDLIFVEETTSTICWIKSCEEDEAEQIFKATVNLIRGAATA